MTNVNGQDEREETEGDFLWTTEEHESVQRCSGETCVRTYRHGLARELNKMERYDDLQTSRCSGTL